jgi:hypothetical protein
VVFLHANNTKCRVVLFFLLMVTYDIILNSGEDFYLILERKRSSRKVRLLKFRVHQAPNIYLIIESVILITYFGHPCIIWHQYYEGFMLDTIVYRIIECNTTILATPGQNAVQAARRSSRILLVK